jgi:hypothetical protein
MTDRGPRRSVLALAGVCGLCCVGFGSLALGGAALGGTVVGVTATDGTIRSLRSLLVTGIATAIPLLVIGFLLGRRDGE